MLDEHFFHPAVPDKWRNKAWDVMRQTPQHQYRILAKRPELIRERDKSGRVIKDRLRRNWDSESLCLITNNFLDSEWTQQEVEFAIARERRVVPLIFNRLKPLGFIEAYQGVHVTNDNLDRIMTESIESIKANLVASRGVNPETVSTLFSLNTYGTLGG